MKKLIYLDNAATTKTSEEVVAAMLPYFTEYYGNPSSVYEFASESKKAVSNARRTIAETLGAQENEIYFTAGGSEADNWALKATAEAYQSKGKHIITSKIEHNLCVLVRFILFPPFLLWKLFPTLLICAAFSKDPDVFEPLLNSVLFIYEYALNKAFRFP